MKFFWPCLLLALVLMARTSGQMSSLERIKHSGLWGLLFAGTFYAWSLAYGPLPWLGLLLVRGLPWVLLALPAVLLEKRCHNTAWHQALGFGVGLAMVAWALLFGPTGNDRETPSSALAETPILLSTLPYLGLVGLAWLLGTACALLSCPTGGPRIAGGILLSLFAAASTLAHLVASPSALPSLKIAVIQTGWSQEEKWDSEARKRGIALLLEATRQANAAGAQLVVWPETAWPNRGMRRRFRDTRAIGKLARRLKMPILATSIEEDGERWFNSASLVSDGGKFISEYQKERLAPFAEYLPVPRALEEKLRTVAPFTYIGRFKAGHDQTEMNLGPYRFRILICFESMVPWPAAQSANDVDFFVVLTNDAPMIYEWPKEDHFRSAILRAAQFRKPVFQASNNGVTGIIDSDGSVVARTAPGVTEKSVLLSP